MEAPEPVDAPTVANSSAHEHLSILFMNWRDTKNPEGGGSEVYVESVAKALAADGHGVTIFCARHGHAPDDEVVDGVRFVRSGTKLSVYLAAARHYRTGRLGRPDIVIDVQNGIPFFTRLIRPSIPSIVLVHHVHREQWPLVYGPLRSKIGWAIESRIAPRLYRGCQYIAVSETTRHELIELGVNPADISVVYNGVTGPATSDHERHETASVVVLGRLVPHKRVEIAIDAVAAARETNGDLQLTIVGDGWWMEHLREYATTRHAEAFTHFTGFVTDAEKHRILATAAVMLLPSIKEGWGLVIMEAALHGVPTIAFRSASGVAESILDAETGVLVDTAAEMQQALEVLLSDTPLRQRLGTAARARALQFTWEDTARGFTTVINRALSSALR